MQNSPMSRAIEVWSEFNLEQSLEASFTLPFFDKIKDEYVKSYGRYRGLRIRQERNLLEFEGGSRLEAMMLSGAWFNPHVEIRRINRNERNILEKLLDVFPGLGIAINPWDKIATFYTVFLSRNTDYHSNTVKWVKRILREAQDEEMIKSVNLSEVGKSYQLRQLIEVRDRIDSLFSLGEFKKEKYDLEDFLGLRTKMLSIKYCGPKVVHGWGLFTLGLTYLSQVDRHLLNIGRSLRIINPDDRNPEKALCITSRCFLDRDCRILERCVTYKLYRLFGCMAGWFQTAAYLYGARYLSKGIDPYSVVRK